MSRFHQPLCIAFSCQLTALLVTACLPGESDVAQKYNAINQRAQVENTGMSLMQAANDMTAYQIAKNIVRKAPLDDIGVTALTTVPEDDRPEPVPPQGIKVVACKTADGKDRMGALAYFIAQPKGIAPLEVTGATMAKALAQRYGGKAVGLAYGNGKIDPPKVSEAPELDCHVENDILPFSPIFASGFEYNGYDGLGLVIPDTKAATWPTVKSDFTMPCPSGLDGVVKRERVCKLITDENSTKAEETKVTIGWGDGAVENKAVRTGKAWECDPAVGAAVTPTAEEIAEYCRDPNDGLSKQADNAIELPAESLKKIIEEGSGDYLFKCRRNSDGTNSCDAKAYTPNDKVPKDTIMRCDKQTVPEQYVINPILPIEVDGDGKVRSATPAATKTGTILGNSSCGLGWTGDLIAGYQVRACRLIKVVNGVETPLKLAQTIYRIGYVGARCNAPPKEGKYDCPQPYDGKVILRESNYMTRPLALQLGTAPAGEWSPSTIPYAIFGGFIGNANAETRARARQESYVIANRPLQGVQNPTFSSRLEAAMSGYMKKDITGCKLLGQTCKLPPDPINLAIVFDRSLSMTTVPPLSLTSMTNRMSCHADIASIFSDEEAACALLSDNARGEYPPDGRMIEAVLGEYLIDRHNPTFNNMMIDAINNKSQCGEMSVDKVGYCKATGEVNQSSCSPGTCVPQGAVTGSKLTVAQDQLKTAISLIPPGSNFDYIEYMNDGISVSKTIPVCNTVTDENCDFAQELNKIRGAVDDNDGSNGGGTPLMEATQRALDKIDRNKPGLLIYFSDGQESDGIVNDRYKASYPRPFGSICGHGHPPSRYDGNPDEFCRHVGITESNADEMDEDQAESIFSGHYTSNNCGNPSVSTTVCGHVRGYYDGTKLLGDSWRLDCREVGTSSRESVVNYIQREYPNLRVFILNLGTPELASCPDDPNGRIRMIDVSRPENFSNAFREAFPQDSGPAAAEAVCQRVRARSYPNATSY